MTSYKESCAISTHGYQLHYPQIYLLLNAIKITFYDTQEDIHL
jgi:hypothetical protein